MMVNGGESVIGCIWKSYNKAFEQDILSKDWRRAVMVPFHKSKGGMGAVAIIVELVYSVVGNFS